MRGGGKETAVTNGSSDALPAANLLGLVKGRIEGGALARHVLSGRLVNHSHCHRLRRPFRRKQKRQKKTKKGFKEPTATRSMNGHKYFLLQPYRRQGLHSIVGTEGERNGHHDFFVLVAASIDRCVTVSLEYGSALLLDV